MAAPLADSIDLFSLSSLCWNGPERKRTKDPVEEPEPSHLNVFNSSRIFHKLSPNKLSIQDAGIPQHGHDVVAVQANCPAPTKRNVYYFEMTINNTGQPITIGFTTNEFNLWMLRGWEEKDSGYHRYFGPTFTSGDTVGAGINYASRQFFFTKNGKLVGKIVKDTEEPLYPTIAVHSQNEDSVMVNFGEQPFLFDIKALELEERRKVQVLIEEESLTSNTSFWIVRSYLLHYGYQDTLNLLDIESESLYPAVHQQNGIEEKGDAYSLEHRKILHQLIKNGDIDSAFQKIKEWHPQVLQNDTSFIAFLLHAQRFIEYVRNHELLEAVSYARSVLRRFVPVKSCADLLKDALALLAYDDPQKSCVGYLLEDSRREFVADAVNAVVLSTNPIMSDPRNCMYSCLEKLLRQLAACCSERRALNRNQGWAFDLQTELEINLGSG